MARTSAALASTAKANDREFDPINLDQKWVDSLPEYTGPSKVHALQIQHIEHYGQGGALLDRKGQKPVTHQSLASVPQASAVPVTERQQPEDYREHAAARLTPVDKSYAAFEVDENYMRECRPHTGGYYVVFETGAEGFERPETFTQKYTLVVKQEEIDARAAQAKQIADQAAKQAEEDVKKAEAAGDKATADLARLKLKNHKDAASAQKTTAAKPAAKAKAGPKK